MANDSRHITVTGEQHVPAGRHIHRELINARDPQFSIGKNSASDTTIALISTRRDLQRPPCEITTRFIFDLQNLDTSGFGFQRRIHKINAVAKSCTQEAFQRSNHKRLRGMTREFSLQT